MYAALGSVWKFANFRSQAHAAILACLVAVVCYYTARLTTALGIPPEHIISFWAATPFLVAVLLVSSRRIWPVLIAFGLAGMALADLKYGWPIGSELWFTLGNLVEVLIVILGTSYLFNGVPQLCSRKAFAKFLLVVMPTPFVAALVGASFNMPTDIWRGFRLWFFADTLGLLTVTPAIWSWVQEGRKWARNSYNLLELLALMALLTTFGYLTFMGIGRWQSPALLYSLVPIFLWAALRLGLKGVSTSSVVVAILSIWGASHDRGPFTGQGPLNNALSIQLFLFFAVMSFMFLAVLVEEQKQTQGALIEETAQLVEAQRLAQVGSWWWNPKTDTVTWSDELYQIAGRDPRSPAPSYKEHPQLYTPESWARLQQAVEKALRAGEAYELDLEMVRPDGSTRWVIARGEALRDASSHIAYLRGTVKDITERKRAEEALRESEERLRLAVRMGKMYAIDWDVATDVVIRSDEATHVHGLPGDSTRLTHRQILDRVHPEDRATFISSIADLTPGRPNCQTSFRVLRPDGSVLWLERTGHAFFDEQGKMVRMIGIVADITERKLAEHEIALANDRLRMAMESGKSVGWDRDVKSGRDILFGDLQGIFGIPMQTYVGRVEDFHRHVHPEDRGRIVKTINDAMESRKPYKAEFRVVLPNGTMRWLSAKGKFHYSPGGEPERMVGMAVDITERKLAEEALSTVSQKLIEAQEHERSRLARELHDDINQRMALLAVNLDRMKKSLPGSAVQLGQQIEGASGQVADITKDVQALSHHLHSSKLEILGLAAAAKSFCREFSERHHLEIEYRSEDIPRDLSPQISLSLFRILQEGLQNAAKHSGSRHFRVSLTGRANEIELTVHDSGSGFELEEAIKGRGLGLTSMKERIKLVDGELSIDSELQHGTTLHARVPLGPTGKSAAAVG